MALLRFYLPNTYFQRRGDSYLYFSIAIPEQNLEEPKISSQGEVKGLSLSEQISQKEN